MFFLFLKKNEDASLNFMNLCDDESNQSKVVVRCGPRECTSATITLTTYKRQKMDAKKRAKKCTSLTHEHHSSVNSPFGKP
jgi:hypothetical protein